MKIGCIILSNTQDMEMYGMCQRAIHTLLWSEPNHTFNIVVVESNKQLYENGFIYDLQTPNIKTVIPKDNFGYNKFLNYGLKALREDVNGLPDWVVVANSDVIFTQNWLTNMLEWQSKNPDVLSLSPWEPKWHKDHGLDSNKEMYMGYRTSYEITGWCLVIHKTVFDICSLFDPAFEFWYQDNDYALTLQNKQVKHALVVKSRVYHMISKTHHTISSEEQYRMTHGQFNILKNKWGNV